MDRRRLALLIAACAALALVLALFLLRGPARDHLEPLPVAQESISVADHPDRAQGKAGPFDGTALARAAARLEVQEAPVPDPAGSITVRVRWAETLEPAVGLEVVLTRSASIRSMPSSRLFSQRTDRSGCVRFDGLAPGAYGAYLDRGLSASVKLEPGAEEVVDWRLDAGRPIHGRVVDGAGRAVPRAEVWFRPRIPNPDMMIVTTDDLGEFQALGLRQAGSLVARHPRLQPSQPAAIDAVEARPERVDVVLTMSGEGSSITGTVRMPNGEPARDATVRLEYPDPRAAPSVAPAPLGRLETTTDTTGAFRFEALGAGAATVRAWTPSTTVTSRPLDIQPGEQPCELRLASGATVSGRIATRSGEPAPGSIVGAGRVGSPGFRTAVADGRGEFVLSGLPRGETKLVAAHPAHGRAESTLSVTEDSQHSSWSPVLSGGVVLRGRILARGAPAAAEWAISIRPEDPTVAWSRRTLARDGRFEVEDCREGALRVTVFDPLGSPLVPVAVMSEVDPKAGELTIAFDHAPADASVAGRVRGPDGAPARGARILLQHVRTGLADARDSDVDGRFEFQLLPPGGYEISIHGERGVRHDFDPLEITASQRLDLGELWLPEPATIRVEIVAPALAAAASPRVSAWSERPVPVADRECPPGGVCSLELRPGAYRIQVEVADFAPWSGVATVVAGESLSLRAELVAGAPLAIRATRATGPSDLRADTLVLSDDRESVVWSGQFASTGRSVRRLLHVPSGSYSLRWSRRSRVVAERRIDVREQGAEVEIVEP